MNNFGWAIAQMHEGRRLARKGWNGKDQYVFMIDNNRSIGDFNLSYDFIDGDVEVNPFLAFFSNGSLTFGWLASQVDMLSNDWYVVE
jgi:hypothetical protein